MAFYGIPEFYDALYLEFPEDILKMAKDKLDVTLDDGVLMPDTEANRAELEDDWDRLLKRLSLRKQTEGQKELTMESTQVIRITKDGDGKDVGDWYPYFSGLGALDWARAEKAQDATKFYSWSRKQLADTQEFLDDLGVEYTMETVPDVEAMIDAQLKKSVTESGELIRASSDRPRETGSVPYRIVLRNLGGVQPYATHMHFLDTDSYENGNYFSNLDRAVADYKKRCQTHDLNPGAENEG